ncbi:serine/threonine-protein kinase WNK8-like [Chenopodium quinoa]|uniref:serine/threonine-protein kinase WNK8-like n=1 Tax=Chenopodium quinoa TaxID=63459 RepID=UPI000B781AD8|nr:serine/threonine-protein kinase WNK8-like [Chenopodium quinoa]
MAGSSSSGGDDDYTVEETDPSGDYTRYKNLIEESSSKSVFKGYDRPNGKEVAWIKRLKGMIVAEKEAYLMRLNHSNVLKCYYSWDNQETNTLDQITENYSGNLSDFIENHTNFSGTSLAVIQNWSLQIIEALLYLHEQHILVIQNNLRIENLYVVGESGTVKIGDLSDATFITTEALLQMEMEAGDPATDAAGRAMQEEIQRFGQCVLQMVTKSLRGKLIIDKQCKNFIKSCFLPGDTQPTLEELLHQAML